MLAKFAAIFIILTVGAAFGALCDGALSGDLALGLHVAAKHYRPMDPNDRQKFALGTQYFDVEKVKWAGASGVRGFSAIKSRLRPYKNIYRASSLSGKITGKGPAVIHIPEGSIGDGAMDGMANSITFIASSQTPGAKFTLHIPLKRQIYTFEFAPTTEPKTFTFNLQRALGFSAVDEFHRDRVNVENIFIEANAVDDATKFEFTFYGPIIFETDLTFELNKTLEKYNEIIRLSRFLHKSEFSKEKLNELLKKVISNLHNDKKQRQAIKEFRSMSRQKYVSLLKSEGFDIFEMDDKVSEAQFFATGQFSNLARQNPLIPVETGGFGADHGEFSHALQIRTMMAGLNRSERELFLKFYKAMFRIDSFEGWLTWNLLFDAGGYRLPNAPRYWRNLLLMSDSAG
jgi:hypothetical protein